MTQLGAVNIQDAGAAHRLVVLLVTLRPGGKNVATFEVRDSTVFLQVSPRGTLRTGLLSLQGLGSFFHT